MTDIEMLDILIDSDERNSNQFVLLTCAGESLVLRNGGWKIGEESKAITRYEEHLFEQGETYEKPDIEKAVLEVANQMCRCIHHCIDSPENPVGEGFDEVSSLVAGALRACIISYDEARKFNSILTESVFDMIICRENLPGNILPEMETPIQRIRSLTRQLWFVNEIEEALFPGAKQSS